MHLSSPAGVQAAVQGNRDVGTELEINFWPDGNRAYTVIQAADFASLLHFSPSLEQIRMYHVGLEGDLQPVLEALRQRTWLQRFLAQCCHFNPIQMANTLSELPLLEHLIIVGHYFRNALRIPMVDMTRLVDRNTLKVLELNPMGSFTSIEEAASFLEAVNHSTSLKTLWCLSKFTDSYVNLVGDMMRENNSLETFKLSVAPGVPLVPIAEGLAVNSTLLELDIRLETAPVVSDLECFHEVLETSNFSLKQLRVANETQWSDEDHKHVPIYREEKVKQAAEKLDFYLSLNRRGRYKLLADTDHMATPQDWLDAIADNQDLSVLFYFARRNPYICMPRSLGGIMPAPTPESIAKEEAKQAAKYSFLYQFGDMELRGPKHVQAAVEDPNPRPVTKITVHFPHGRPGQPAPVLQASDFAAIIRRQTSSFTSLMFYFVTVEGDFQQVLDALRKRNSFQYFFAQGSRFDVNGLVRVLWDMPNFDSLTLTWSEATMANLTTLLYKRSMKSLLVSGTPATTDKEVADFFEAAEKSPRLNQLECILSSSFLTTNHLGHVSRFLRNHKCIQSLEIKVARGAYLVPIAESLEPNASLTRLTIIVDGMDPNFPLINLSDITAFRDVLATTNVTLKNLKVCQESWHGDHLWKPSYARDDAKREILQEIEDYLAQNSKGRLLPVAENKVQPRSEAADSPTLEQRTALELQVEELSVAWAKDNAEKEVLKREIQELKERLTQTEQLVERLKRQINQQQTPHAVQEGKPKWRMFRHSKTNG